MTTTEKIKMYAKKKAFINKISAVFETTHSTTVESVSYEVYQKEISPDTTYFTEYVIVNYIGGGKSVRIVNGNSDTANFRAIGTLLDGGYYDELPDYETLADRGFKAVKLSDTPTLDELLSKPMKHIRDVEACFDYCRDSNDIERVIRMIPSAFGTFEVDYDKDDEDEFYICNTYYDETDSEQSETYTFEFYKGEI